MASKNGCNEAAQLLLANGAFVEAKANVCFVPLFICLSCLNFDEILDVDNAFEPFFS